MAGKKGATRKKGKRKTWTKKEERKAIAMRLNRASLKRIARELDRTVGSVRWKLRDEGIMKPPGSRFCRWQPWEKAILEDRYAILGPGGIFNQGLLPARTRAAIRRRAMTLGLRVDEEHPHYKQAQNGSNSLDLAVVKERLLEHGFKLLEDYTSYSASTLMECATCRAQEYKQPNNIFNGHGCFSCEGAKSTTLEGALSWLRTNEVPIRPKEGSHFTANCCWSWRCLKEGCGHEWKTTFSSIKNNGTRCPGPGKCSGKRKEGWLIEIADKIFGRKAQHNLRPEWLCSRKTGRSLEVDAYYSDIGPAGLAIEGNGLQHYKVIEAWGGIEQFKTRQTNDQETRDLCAIKGAILIEVNYSGVKTRNEERAKKEIEALLIEALRACGNEEVRKMIDAHESAS